MTKLEKALALPFVVFVGLFALELAPWPAGVEARYVIYPLQTAVCAALLWRWRRRYEFNIRAGFVLAAGVGALAFALWVAPQVFFGAAPRLDGFDPQVFAGAPWLYWSSLALRFIRLVVVVPLVEELFWRGFLLRYLIAAPADKIPFGQFSWLSFSVVSIGFMVEHQRADYAAALATGMLYNWVACRAKSQGACVFAHAVTNLLLGIYVMRSGQWGFW